jgi:soluble lytic murein transglycosylase-like protein
MQIWRDDGRAGTMVAMRPLCLLLPCLLLAAVPGRAAADIYRSVDRDGVEHYTNIQPSGRGWQRIARTHEARAQGARAAVVTAPDPERLRRFDAHIREASQLYVLPEELLRAVMQVESNFYATAISNKGAIGLMQLMPGTASQMGVLDPFAARQNVLGGARFLRLLANHFGGDLVLTIAAYNAGQGAVEKYSGIPPFSETRLYVQHVLSSYYAYRAAQPTNALARR